jgi:hypothetical protein
MAIFGALGPTSPSQLRRAREGVPRRQLPSLTDMTFIFLSWSLSLTGRFENAFIFAGPITSPKFSRGDLVREEM